MNRRQFLRFTSAAAVSQLVAGCRMLPFKTQGNKTGTKKPNIILIFSDDQGYSDLGCCGSKEVISPNLDKMAAEGVRLTDFYVTASVCTPSRSGLLTGRYPHRNGLFDMIRNNMTNFGHIYKELEYAVSPEGTQGLDTREVVIAEALKPAGYATGVFGKWDSGRARRFMPLQRGFDTFYGFSNTGIDYWTHERYEMPSMFRQNKRIKEKGYATDLFKRETIKFIEKNKDKPFFIYLPFNSPHGASNLKHRSVQAPDKYIKMYGDLPGTNRQRYMAAITCMDDAVGEIQSKLKQLGLDDNTLIIFTCDNGCGDTTPLRGGKGYLYEGGVRVPFIARWPERIPSGQISDEFCSALDLFPTFLRMAGVKPSKDIKLDGYDMLPVLTGKGKSRRKDHFWEWQAKRAARVGKWKWVMETDRYVLPKDMTGELYDLSVDIGEKNNLATEKPERLKWIRSRWDKWMKEMVASEPRGPFGKAYLDKIGYGDGSYRISDEDI
jgi:arylsulfatase A-like enzyme